MKHLKLLKDAGLVVTKRVGRLKYLNLNPVPFQDMLNRWVVPFLQLQAKHRTDLKPNLERTHNVENPWSMMQTFIRCTGDRLWQAPTKADQLAADYVMYHALRGNASVGNVTEVLLPNGNPVLPQLTTEMGPKSRIAASPWIPTSSASTKTPCPIETPSSTPPRTTACQIGSRAPTARI